MSRISLYEILFGKDHIRDGDVISMSEHGRVGGISTGVPFKAIQSLPNKTILDQTDGSAIYIGEAGPKALTSESVWRISKLVVGTITTIYFANQDDGFTKEWDERANYTFT